MSRLGWGRVWLGGSIGSEGGRSGIEWMLSIGGIGVDASAASAASGAGMGVSSAIFVAVNEIGDPEVLSGDNCVELKRDKVFDFREWLARPGS